MSKLKPCPFCGNDVAVIVLDQNEIDFVPESADEYNKNPYYVVVCSMTEDHSPLPVDNWRIGCGACSGYRETKEKAISAWNRRV